MVRTGFFAVTVTITALVPSVSEAAWETAAIAGADARVYTPATTSKIGDGRGLLVVLPGCSQSADSLRDFGNFELAAEEFGFVIAIPNVPAGGTFPGCWDYYGPAHTRTDRHNGIVIGLAEAMRDDPAYDIDPAQVYLTGLSSGGGEAVVAGCLAPDVFAGVGVVAGPAVGTTIQQIQVVGTTGSQAAALCRQLSGNSPDFETQLAVTYTDSTDFVVAQDYAEINAQMYAELFTGGLASMSESALEVASLEGASPAGVGTVYSDDQGERIIWLKTDGVGHNWPAGSGEAGGGGLTFVSASGPNFSYLLAEFFTANSLRADGSWNPSDSGGDDGGSGGETTGAGSGSDASDGSPGSDDDSGSDESGSSDGGDAGDSGDTEGPGAAAPSEDSGCQCRAQTTPSGTARWAALLAGLLFGFRRRSETRKRRRVANV